MLLPSNVVSQLTQSQLELKQVSDYIARTHIPELKITGVEWVADKVGQIGVRCLLDDARIYPGDLIEIKLGNVVVGQFEFTRADSTIYLNLVPEVTGQEMSVEVVTKSGNRTVFKQTVNFNWNTLKSVSADWLNYVGYLPEVLGFTAEFLNGLPLDVVKDLSTQFVEKINCVNSLSADFLNHLSFAALAKVGSAWANELSSAMVLKLSHDWDEYFPTIFEGELLNKAGAEKVKVGSVLEIRLMMTETVYLSDTNAMPVLNLKNGGKAYYVSGAGTQDLRFTYLVEPGQTLDGFGIASIDTSQGYFKNKSGVYIKLGSENKFASLYIGEISGWEDSASLQSMPALRLSGTDGVVSGAERNAGVTFTMDLGVIS